VALMEETRNACRIFAGMSLGKRLLRISKRWGSNIKMYVREIIVRMRGG
jgi:hypothetical protein